MAETFDLKNWFDEEAKALENDPEYISYGLMIDLAAQISAKLEKEGLKQKDLAKRLDKSQGWISRVINSPTNFSVKKLVELGSALSLELEIKFKDSQANNFKPKTIPGQPKATPSKQLSFATNDFTHEKKSEMEGNTNKEEDIAA